MGVKGIELASLEPALQTILEEMRAALVEKHPALLVDERLQKLELRFGQLNLCGERCHGQVTRDAQSDFTRNSAEQAYFAAPTSSAASSNRLYSGRCSSLAISNKMMRRPLSLPTPVT